MFAIKAYYDGKSFIPETNVDLKPMQKAIIVIDDVEKSKEKSSAKGIAHKYANINLIPLEEKTASMAFSGE